MCLRFEQLFRPKYRQYPPVDELMQSYILRGYGCDQRPKTSVSAVRSFAVPVGPSDTARIHMTQFANLEIIAIALGRAQIVYRRYYF
jgi:hypothetical protein